MYDARLTRYSYHDDNMMSNKIDDDVRVRTAAGEAMTGLMLDLFKLNSLLLTAGDRLVAGLGLTSARWQILGAIAFGERLRPVAWLARDLGANRQNIQRIVNDLHRDGLVAFTANPHHRRAPLVMLTEEGTRTFEAARRLQIPWVNRLAHGLSAEDVTATERLVAALRERLQPSSEPQSDPDRR
jgi:DNA-binding MarR family transcriptional regulator